MWLEQELYWFDFISTAISRVPSSEEVIQVTTTERVVPDKTIITNGTDTLYIYIIESGVESVKKEEK